MNSFEYYHSSSENLAFWHSCNENNPKFEGFIEIRLLLKNIKGANMINIISLLENIFVYAVKGLDNKIL